MSPTKTDASTGLRLAVGQASAKLSGSWKLGRVCQLGTLGQATKTDFDFQRKDTGQLMQSLGELENQAWETGTKGNENSQSPIKACHWAISSDEGPQCGHP